MFGDDPPADERQPFLLDPESMAQGQLVALAGTAPGLRRVPKRDLILLLGSIDTSQIADRRGVTRERCAALLAEGFGMPMLDASAADDSGKSCFRLDLIVSDMRPGAPQLLGIVNTLAMLSRSRRWYDDDRDHDTAWLQVEGLVTGLAAAEPAMTFSHRVERLSIGGYGGSTTARSGWQAAAEASIALLAAEAASHILQEIGAALAE